MLSFPGLVFVFYDYRHTKIPDFLEPEDADGLPGSYIILDPRREADPPGTRGGVARGASRNEERRAEDKLQQSGSQQLHSPQLNKSFKIGNIISAVSAYTCERACQRSANKITSLLGFLQRTCRGSGQSAAWMRTTQTQFFY